MSNISFFIFRMMYSLYMLIMYSIFLGMLWQGLLYGMRLRGLLILVMLLCNILVMRNSMEYRHHMIWNLLICPSNTNPLSIFSTFFRNKGIGCLKYYLYQGIRISCEFELDLDLGATLEAGIFIDLFFVM